MHPAVRSTLVLAARYGILTFASIWIAWTAVDVRYLQGWSEAQGAKFYYPMTEIAGGVAALTLGWCLARTGKHGGSVIAFIVLAICEMYWIGYTR